MVVATILVIALIAAALLRWTSWRKTALGLFLAALLLILGIGCGPVAGWMARSLQAGYPAQPTTGWGTRTGIILLGGGTERVADSGAIETTTLAYGRLVKALELYVACKRHGGDCFILASGGDPRHHGLSEAAAYGLQLEHLGVAHTDIVLEPKSWNTWQNAQFSAQLLSQHPADRLFLVTSGVHLHRALLYFGHFGLHPTPVRADYVAAILSPVPLAYNLLLADLALHEYWGILLYPVYPQLGRLVAHDKPGAI
jgi:uncharacterized SAM-binding protein YcdF (DUF218 family)